MNLEWSLSKLLDKIKEWEGVAEETKCRLKNLEKKSLYIKEEMNKKLKDLGFEEGGLRIKLEIGDVPGLGDIALKVKEYTTKVTVNLFVKAETTVDEWYSSSLIVVM